ncbi:serine hydrolase domain-containing protein [Falsiroseomonas bella]|uniref:serine hydrolase domain-containing protein n=1 Tax=Falsiroseomonas bella TaxID=2184016 RepID=UPI0018EEC3AC|nr:serine hydrolase domain-containing protein [Falsiroseomonas bella]
MDALLHRAVEQGTIAGAVVLLWRRGTVRASYVGEQAPAGPPMRRESLFRIASVTKPILAVATLALVEEGRLTLDGSVEPWLPELASRRVLRAPRAPLQESMPAQRPISVRDLLTMRCGLGALDFLDGPKAPLRSAMEEAGVAPGPFAFAGDSDDFMRRIGALPLAHQPGERWLYHTASDILGVLLARCEGKPLGAVLQERVLGPLGMTDTGFSVPEAQIGRLTAACRARPDGALELFDPAQGGRFAAPPLFESGGGGLVSTADDLLALGRMMLSGGRHGDLRVLGRNTVAAMVTDQITPAQKAASPFFPGFWEARGWGLGVGVVTHRDGPAGSPGRFGWDGGFGTSFWCDPAEELIGVLLTQRMWDAGWMTLYEAFWNGVYAALD